MSSPAPKRKITSPHVFPKQIFSPAQKTQKLDDGTITLKNILSEMGEMEKRLQKHAEQLVSKLSIELTAVETKLMNKIENDIKLISERANDIEDRIASIESELSNADKLSVEIDALRKEVEDIKTNRLERTVGDIASDAIIFGIPNFEAVNLKSIFNQVCRSIDFLAPQIRDIFRVTSKTKPNNTPIVIVKFYTPFDRNRTLKAFSDFRRNNRISVSMRSAGFDCDTSFRIYESLNADSRKILQLATQIKREKKIWNAFSSRGKIYIRPDKNTEAIYIPNEQALRQFM